MGLQIMTNELSLAAQRHLSKTNDRLNGVLQTLASGSRINKAADDAAGLAISENLRAQVRSLGQAIRNAQDGVSLVQVFEGGTSEINNLILRIRELSMRSASDTVGDRERKMLNQEVQQTKEEIDRIAKTTEFGGSHLLDGTTIEMSFQVGVNNDEEVDRITFDPGDTNLTLESLELSDVDVSEKVGAQESFERLDDALFQVNEVRARVGSVQSRLQSTIEAQGVFRENLAAANARVRDADLAAESSKLARETILREAGVAVLMQANQTPRLALQLLKG